MQPLRVVIIEDEKHSQALLTQIIKEYCPYSKVIAIIDNIKDSINYLQNNSCDVVFADIELKDGKSLSVFEKFDSMPFHLIFTTAYETYALDAFKLEAVDYLLKPFSPQEVCLALQKAYNQQQFDLFKIINQRKEEGQKRFSIATADHVTLIKYDDITHCEASGSYTMVYTKEGRKHLASKTLKDIEDQLSDTIFTRIHSKYLINLNYIKHYLKEDGGEVVLENGTHLPISRRRKNDFLNRLAL